MLISPAWRLPTREEIARVIDPVAAEMAGRVTASVAVNHAYAEEWQIALTKADTIRALYPVAPPGGEDKAQAEPHDITDLAIMLRKLVYIIRKESTEARTAVPKALAMCDRAIDLLERKGLQGNPLREDTPPLGGATDEQESFPGPLVHKDACLLSVLFNRAASLGVPQHYRINEWLKRLIENAPDHPLNMSAEHVSVSTESEPVAPPPGGVGEGWKPDTDGPVNFYERDFYPLSNFSAFKLTWAGRWVFDTSEAAYHWLRFSTGDAADNPAAASMAIRVKAALSAHAAFKLAQENKHLQRTDWDAVKVGFMREIIRTKAHQHEYVHRKLLETGDRPLVEGSWRDAFWGAGADGNGQNMLGKLWVELRTELLSAAPAPPLGGGGLLR
jgi:ribA/ribD-fused uncharacterized protein